MSKVAIVGLGYVGLPLAVFAQLAGHEVTGIDLDLTKVDSLKSGNSYVEDVSNEILHQALVLGFTATNEWKALSDAEIIITCVPTPLNNSGEPDLSYLKSAAIQIASNAKDGTLFINESTSYPGTTSDFLPGLIREENETLQLLFASAPERIDPGNRTWNLTTTPRLVSGVGNEATQLAIKFYQSFCKEVIEVSKPEVAEFAKLLENTFRLVNISLINELVPLANKIGVSIYEVINAASTKPYGFSTFYPSVGVGGHCIPIDPVYLEYKGKELAIELDIVRSSIRENEKIREFILTLTTNVRKQCDNSVLVIGITYKPGTADIRESASIALIEQLKMAGWKVEWWDALVNNSNFESWKFTQRNFLVIVTQKIDDNEIEEIIESASHIIDCTGVYKEHPRAISF